MADSNQDLIRELKLGTIRSSFMSGNGPVDGSGNSGVQDENASPLQRPNDRYLRGTGSSPNDDTGTGGLANLQELRSDSYPALAQTEGNSH